MLGTRMSRAAVVLSLLSGCGDERIAVYDAPKDAPSAPAARAERSPGLTAAAGEALTWTLPAGWKERGASAMRAATFEIPAGETASLELSVVVFPGAAGGDLANVNRWRGQLQLAPVAAEELDRQSEWVQCPAGRIRIVDLKGNGEDGPARLLGGILSWGGRSWFFKTTGAPDDVGRVRDRVLEFLGTVRAAPPR